MLYAIWNPLPWALFLLGIAICVLSVKAFHRKYPDYPHGIKQIELQESSLATRVNDLAIPSSSPALAMENAKADPSSYPSAIVGR